MEILYITLLTILASMVGTLTGFGTSTIMVPVLLLFMPLPQTLLLVGIIHWFGDIWKMLLFRKGFNWRLILLFGATGIIASYAGANIVFSVSGQVLSQILGGFLILYALFIFLKPAFKIPQTNLTALGVGGAVRGAFLSAFDLPKAVYLATAGAIGFFVDITRLTAYIANGVRLEPALLWGFVLFIPATLLGAKWAQKIVHHIPQKKFRALIAVFLFLVGLKFF